MKLPGCEILGTAAGTLAPITNFPCAAAGCFGGVSDGVSGHNRGAVSCSGYFAAASG